jgi:hypothetical protein
MKQATFLAALGLAVVVCPLPDSFRATAQASTQQGTALVSPGMEAPAKLPDLVVKQVWLDEACQIRYRIEGLRGNEWVKSLQGTVQTCGS